MIKDKFYKILFALQLALIPMLFYAEYFCKEKWVLTLIICLILSSKMLSELFCYEKNNKLHNILNMVENVLIFTVIAILLIFIGVVNTAVSIIVIILNIVMNILLLTLNYKKLPKFIEMVDFSYIIILCYAYFSFAFAKYYLNLALVGMIAVIVVTLVSISYKIYYIFKYTDVISKIKTTFSKIKFKKSTRK